MGCTRLIKGWEHDCDQAVENAVVIGLHGGENPVRKVHRIGLRLGRYRPEILAGCPEDVPLFQSLTALLPADLIS